MRAACILVATGMLAVGCGDESEEAPRSDELANGNHLSACLSNAGLESRVAGFFVKTGDGDAEINGEQVQIGPAGDPDAFALVVPAKQANEAEKFEAVLADAQLVGQNVLVTPHDLGIAVGSESAAESVPEEIVDQVRACVAG